MLAGKKMLVTVISGLPGAGKSALTRHVLHSKEELRVAVFASDVRGEGSGLGGGTTRIEKPSSKIFEGECICCSRRVDFVIEVMQLAKLGIYDHLLVETCGAAEPQQIAELFRGDVPDATDELEADITSAAMSIAAGGYATGGSRARKRRSQAASLRESAELDTMVTVVDGPAVLQHLCGSGGPGGSKAALLLVRQVEFADIIVVNKSDLLTREQEGVAKQLLGLLNPEAGVLFAQYGQVPVCEVLGRGENMWCQLKVQQPSRRWLEKGHRGVNGMASAYSSRPCASACCPPLPQVTASASSSAGVLVPASGVEIQSQIASFTYRPTRPFHPGRLDTLMKGATRLPAGLVRATGLAWIASRTLQCGVWSTVGMVTEIGPGPEWWVVVPRARWPESVPPLLQGLGLLGLDGKWTDVERGDCHTDLEVVYTGPTRGSIEAALSELLVSEDEFAQGVVAWASFADPLPAWAFQPGEDALSCLALGGSEGLLEALCLRRADPNARNSITGGTALHAAALKGRERSVHVLLRSQADCNITAQRGLTPLHIACGAAVIELLCRNGADLDVRDTNGFAPLHHAAALGDPGRVATLLRLRAEVDPVTKVNETPLHLVAKNQDDGFLEAADLLCDAGASLTLLSGVHGQNARGVAQEFGREAMARMLCARS